MKEQYWTVLHMHEYGASGYIVRCDSHTPDEAEVVAACGIDFEPDKGEEIDIAPLETKDAPVIP